MRRARMTERLHRLRALINLF